MSNHYLGHMPDGSSVQRHSAGGLYPFIPFIKDTPNGLRYGVICPDGTEVPAIFTHGEMILEVGHRQAERERAARAATRAAKFKAGREWALGFARVQLTVPCGLTEDAPQTRRQMDAAHWGGLRDYDLWYDPLVKSGKTTDEEVKRLQAMLGDESRGIPMPATARWRYDGLRRMVGLPPATV